MATTNQPDMGNKDKNLGKKNPQQQTGGKPNVDRDQNLRNPQKSTDPQKMVNDTEDERES